MLPPEWELKLVDMNTVRLSDKDIKWADMVFVSAMVVQKDSAKIAIKRCKKLGATDYIIKPFSKEKVDAALAKAGFKA